MPPSRLALCKPHSPIDRSGAYLEAELAMLYAELAGIALYPGTLDALCRICEQGVRIAVASNLVLPYAVPLKALLAIWWTLGSFGGRCDRA